MIYENGAIIGDREVVKLSYTLGNVKYYTVRCVNCSHKSLLSGTSLSRIKSRDKGCGRCYRVNSKQAFGNYRTIKEKKAL